MRTEADKGNDEIATFRRFVEICGLPIDVARVSKRDPPEPDLLCLHETEGPIAFELASLCDRQIAEMIAAGPKTRTSAIWTSDPSAEIVRRKLGKHYSTECPVELLLYTDDRLITPDDVIIPTISPLFQEIAGPYRRAWFMGETMVRELWSTSK